MRLERGSILAKPNSEAIRRPDLQVWIWSASAALKKRCACGLGRAFHPCPKQNFEMEIHGQTGSAELSRRGADLFSCAKGGSEDFMGSEANAQRAASIAKWKTVVGVSMKSCQIGFQLANEPQTDLGDVLDDVLAAKATSTMHARADALIRYISWAKTNGYIPILFSETVVYAFVNDIGSRSAPTFPRRCPRGSVGRASFLATRKDCRWWFDSPLCRE